jgi:ABC-type Mn2+/Zn2+ transport system permease subunit
MKRHHVVAVFLVICGGLFAYIRFHQGNTEGAIRTGAIFILAGATMFLLARLQPRIRSLIVNVIAIIVLGLFAYQDFMAGDTVWAIILSIVLIIGVILRTCFKTKNVFKS